MRTRSVRQALGETLIDGSIAAVHLQCEPTVAAALAAKIPGSTTDIEALVAIDVPTWPPAKCRAS